MPPKTATKAPAAKKPVAKKAVPAEKKTKAVPAQPTAQMATPVPTPTTAAAPAGSSRVIGGLPMELGTNRILTHYDETAGVALSRWDVDVNTNMGHKVVPLTDAYKLRYSNLRNSLTSELLPKREHLLQLRRQLQKTSEEVHAKKESIERETRTDTNHILQRLDAAEARRQDNILHQVMKIDEELQAIERIVLRVEQANLAETENMASTGVLITSANPGSIPVETVRAPRAVAMCELIQEFGHLSQTIKDKANKQVSIQVDFPADDFPRETAERLEVISRSDNFVTALNVKDHMLWIALQEKDKAVEELRSERGLCQQYADELANWAETSQQLVEENNRLRGERDAQEQRIHDLLRVLRENNIIYEVNKR